MGESMADRIISYGMLYSMPHGLSQLQSLVAAQDRVNFRRLGLWSIVTFVSKTSYRNNSGVSRLLIGAMTLMLPSYGGAIDSLTVWLLQYYSNDV